MVAKKTSLFQQVLVVQAIRPDRLQSAMSLFACRALGKVDVFLLMHILLRLLLALYQATKFWNFPN